MDGAAALTVLVPNAIVILIVLIPAGIARIAVLSSRKSCMTTLPARLGARSRPVGLSDCALDVPHG